MKRRAFIRLAGGGLVVAATGAGLYGYAARNTFPVPDTAIAAWSEAGEDPDPRRHVLSYAILAPNPHNMQPWKADLSIPGEIAIYLDQDRLLPATDPFGRQTLVGLGGFLELLSMAAASIGQFAAISLFPDGAPGEFLDDRRMAVVRLVENADIEPDPLFDVSLDRRTDRRAYDPARPLTEDDINVVVSSAEAFDVQLGIEQGAKLDAIKSIARAAWASELTTEGPMMESMHVLRVGSREIDAHRDGIVINDPLLVMLDRVGLFDRTAMPAPDSAAVSAQIEDFNTITSSTPAYLWIVTRGNTRTQQVDAGRAYTRANLAGTAIGLSMHPNQQALQEYPEVAQHYAEIHDLLDAPQPDFTVQMLSRVGYPAPGSGRVDPAPRRGLAAHLT